MRLGLFDIFALLSSLVVATSVLYGGTGPRIGRMQRAALIHLILYRIT